MAKLRTLRRLVLLLAALIFALILYRWISQERLQYFTPREAVTTSPTPEPTPTRPPPIGGKLDTGRLFNGITLHSSVETAPGVDASTERVDSESYVLDLKLNARVPIAPLQNAFGGRVYSDSEIQAVLENPTRGDRMSEPVQHAPADPAKG